MTGRELYERWVEAMAQQGIAVDEYFDALDQPEQAAWNETAFGLGAE